jgi:hypothetical protein
MYDDTSYTVDISWSRSDPPSIGLLRIINLPEDRYDIIGHPTLINAADPEQAAPYLVQGGDKEAVLGRLRDVRGRLDRLIAAVEKS